VRAVQRQEHVVVPSAQALQRQHLAAHRFGARQHPELQPLAGHDRVDLHRPAQQHLGRLDRLLREHAGARPIGATDVYPRRWAPPTVRMRATDVPRVLGADISQDESLDALRRLGFDAVVSDGWIEATPPATRTDIGIAEDLVEEVARVVGYDRIPVRLPAGPLPAHERHPLEQLRERVRDILVGFGLQDTISYAAIDPSWLTRLATDDACVAPEPLRIVNPTSVTQSVMRPTLRASILDTAQRNLRHRSGVAFFEIAPAYLPRANDLPDERWTIALCIAGRAEPVREGETWLVRERDFDLHDLQAYVSGLGAALGHSLPVGERGAVGLHPGRSAHLAIDGRTVLAAGQLDPRVAERWELPVSTYLAEIDLAWLLSCAPPRASAAAPPRYPPAIRDLAVVVDEARSFAEVESAVVEAAKGAVDSVALLDLYRGPQIGEGKKSFALRILLRSDTGTLSDDDVDKAMRRIQGRLERGLGGLLRG